MVEGALELAAAATRPTSAAPSPAAPSAAAPAALGLVLAALVAVLVALVLLLVRLGLELRGNEGVVLGSEVQLLVDAGSEVAVAARWSELVLALEGVDVLHAHVELVGDPGVGPTLADPAANLVELRFERSPCQGAGRLPTQFGWDLA